MAKGPSAAAWWLIVVALVTGGMWTAAPATAHAIVVASTPVDGSHLDVSPTVLSVEFNEPVAVVDGSAQLIDEGGTRYPLAGDRLADGARRLLLDVAKPLPDGAYLATARVISADTHVVSISIRFSVGAAHGSGTWSDAGDAQSAIGRAVLLPVKAVVYVGVVLSAGLVTAAWWVWPNSLASRRFRLAYRFGSGLLAFGLIARFLAMAAEQAGGLTRIAATTVGTVAVTPFGAALVVATGLSLIALAIPPLSTRPWALGLGSLTSVATITAVTLGGHGAASDLWPLPFAVTFLHVYAISVWLGGVVIVATAGATDSQMKRWHRVAVGHVMLVVLTGATLAVLQIRPVAALFTTSYGVTLLVKVVLVVIAIGIGYRVYRSRPLTGRRSRAALIECGVALCVIGMTSSLSSLTPAKDSYTTDVAAHLDFGAGAVLDVDVDTVRRGAQTITVTSSRTGSQPGDVSVELSSAQANVARLPVMMAGRSAASDGTASWVSDGLIVPASGRWKVTVRFDDGQGPKLASFFYQVL